MRMTPRVTLILKRASSTTRNTKLWPRRPPRHGDWSSKRASIRPRDGDRSSRTHLLLLYYIFRKAEKNRSTSQRNSAVKTPLRWLRHTNFCWCFSSWQTTTIVQISKTILTEFPNCRNHLQQRCPHSTGNLKSSSCLKIFSKRV